MALDKSRFVAYSSSCFATPNVRQNTNHVPAESTAPGGTTASAFDCLTYPWKSAAAVSSCSNDCIACSSQFLPLHRQHSSGPLGYSGKHSDVQATKALEHVRLDIDKNLAEVREKLALHGDIVLSRWIKKSVAKRAAILVRAMPGMQRSQNDNPYRIEYSSEENEDKARARHLLPWLNVEDLSAQWPLLLSLLHHRSSGHPSQWVMFDSGHLKFPFAMALLDLKFNPHCVDMRDVIHYGSLTQWEAPDAHHWHIIGYPRALLILEAQALLSGFLSNVLNIVLEHGLLAPNPEKTGWSLLCNEGFKGLSHLPAFEAPPALRLQNLVGSLKARQSIAEDELWMLQLDAAYARDILATVESSSSHSQKCKDCRVSLLLDVVTEGVLRSRLLDTICKEAEYAQAIHAKHDRQIQQGEIVPELLNALSVLDYLLNLVFSFRNAFSRFTTSLGTFDAHYEFRGCAPPKATKKTHHDPLFHNLHNLYLYHSVNTRYPGEALKFLAQNTGRLHPTLCQILSDMVAIDRTMMSIQCYRPAYRQYTTWESLKTAIDLSDDRERWVEARYTSDLEERTLEACMDELKAALIRFVDTPTYHGRVTPKSFDHFDASHQALDAFWKVYREGSLKVLMERGCSDENIDEHLARVAVFASPAVLDVRARERQMLQVEVGRKEAIARRQQTKGRPIIPVGAGTIGLVPDPRTYGNGASSSFAHSDFQRKSRIPLDKPTQAEALCAPFDDTELQDNRIAVSPATFNILLRMYDSYGSSGKTNTKWADFVNAMAECGMEAHPGESTAVTFKDTKFDKGTLVLHQPHPEPVVFPVMMRSFGRRLQRNFGWSIGDFVEKE